MKNKLITIIAIAGGLSLGLAGTASAATAGHPKPHKGKHPHSVTQHTGKQLANGLLPGSAFGFGTTTSGETNSGGSLLPPQALVSVSSEPCEDLLFDLPIFGQTAVAEDSIDTDTLLGGFQAISQFANSAAAWSFYGQEEARYNSGSCTTYSQALAGNQATGPIALAVNLQSVSNIKVGKNYAFAVSQLAEVSDSLGDATFSIDTTIVADGTNVYKIWNSNTVDTAVPDSWLTSLINRTQALYKA
jgi:hypothetical protein